MNKEEIEAIKDLKEQIKQDKTELPYSEESIQYKQIILNLIYKQQKEIETTAKWQLIATTNYWKEKIRDKIKELEEVKQKEEKENKDEFGINSNTWAIADWGIEVLKELLGE